jgi:hypothetical protein
MALSFGKKAASPPSEPAQQSMGSANSNISSPSPPPPKGGPGKFSWMKTGDAAKKAVKEEEFKKQQAKEASDRIRRFRLKDGAEARVTFLDGVIDSSGVLDIPKWHEHSIKFNGFWKQFVCTTEADQQQACPICTAGDKPSLVGALTIINHTPYIIQNGDNAGKTIVNQRQLFVGKLDTIAALSKIAIKRGGTRGLTMDISRTGDKKPNVGDVFDPQEQVKDWNAFRQKYDLKPEDIVPADYEKENPYLSPEELIALGVGKEHLGPGTGNQKASHSMKDQL